VSGPLAAALNLPQSAGLLVERIAAYSPASALRLQGGTAAARINGEELVLGGDVILSILGISMADARGYERASAAMAQLVDGDALKMSILRSGRVLEVESALVRARRISTGKP
jgi:S1-C subfamily serine protease